MTPRQNRTIYAFYFNSGLREVIPIYPLYAIMFGEHGVSPFELSTLFVIWSAVGLLIEVPSGALADTYSRKWLIVISALFKSSAFLCWYLWQNYFGYALGFILWGTGSSLRSGAWEALLYELLRSWHCESVFTKIYGRIRALALIGVGSGELLGGVLIVNGYNWVLLVSMAIPILATLPFIVYVKDPPQAHDEAEPGTDAHRGPGYFEILLQGLRESVSNRSVLYILLISSLLIMTYGVYDEFISPTLREKGFSLQLVAFLGAFVYFSESAGMMSANRFKFLSLHSVLGCISLAGIILLGAAFSSGVAVVLCIAIFTFLFGLSSTRFGVELQKVIETDSRATVTSVTSFGEQVGGIIGFLLFGWVAEYHGMTGGTLATAVMVVLLSFVFIWLGRKWRI
jgi:MFS family permease